MKVFQDKATRIHYSFEDDVKIIKNAKTGVLSFFDFNGNPLNVPDTLVEATDPEPDGAYTGGELPAFVPTSVFIQRLESLSLWDQVAAAIHADPALNLKFSTSTNGVAWDDAQIRDILNAVGANPDAILKA